MTEATDDSIMGQHVLSIAVTGHMLIKVSCLSCVLQIDCDQHGNTQ